MKSLLAFFLLLASACWSQTDYYVDRSIGNDGNNGTSPATPWQTIQRAATSATANSIVHIKAGSYHENIVMHVSGTAGNPIVFTNYGGSVIIDGSGTAGNILLSITNKSFLTFENLTLQNLTAAYAKGVELTSGNGTCDNITFQNITISDIGWTLNASLLPQDSDNAWAFYVSGQSGGITNLTIDGCRVHDNIIGYSEALSVGGNVNGFVISGCSVYDNTNIGIHVSGKTSIGGPQNGLITSNICYNDVSPIALSAGIYLDGPNDITVEKNSCYENSIGIEVGCERDGSAENITVRDNLLYDNRYSGLAVGGYTTSTTGQVLDSTFRNNMLFKNSSFNSGIAEITVSKASHCVFEDNIVYSNSQNLMMTFLDIQPQSGNLINYNCWFTPSGNANSLIFYWGLATYESFNAYKSGTGQDSNSIFLNPLFANVTLPQPQLVLQPGSPCINTGNPQLTTGTGETDFDGNPRILGNIVDMGAREFSQQLSVPQENIGQSQAVPNPFTTQTIITIGRNLKDATFDLYDVSGRKVLQLGHLSDNEITVERNNLDSGIYLYDVTMDGEKIASGKLIAK